MSVVAQEQVLVVPTELFHSLGHFQGFSPDIDRYVQPILTSGQLSYRPRGRMEEDPSFKQLIPYAVFRYRDEEGVTRLFQYLRGQGNGEARLRAKRSVGVGGHISTLDAESESHDGDSAGVYRAGLLRELDEEVVINTPFEESCVGLINDDETDVGRVHLGVVHVFDVERPNISPREQDILDAQFLPIDAIAQRLEEYESWSQIAVRALVER